MSHQPNPQRRAAIRAEATAWWVRLDGCAGDARQVQAFRDWLALDADHRAAFDEITRLWGELDAAKPLLLVSPKTASKHRPRRFPPYSLALAVCCLLLWFSPLLVWLEADFATAVGETRVVRLSDGSSMTLNSDSAVAVNFNSGTRQINLLKGEAWFQVSPDSWRPFRVHADHGRVTALGTAFNVRLSYHHAEVTVTEHTVAVELDGGNKPVLLNQGQRLRYSSQQGIGSAETVDTHAVTAWQRGKLVFQNKPLGEVIAELNRYHRGHIAISDAAIAQRRVNGVFRTEQPLAVVNALEDSLQLHSTRIGGYFVILHR